MQKTIDLTMLDNPAWHALNGPQAHLSKVSGSGARYLPEVVPFAAVASPEAESARQLDGLLAPGGSFFLIGELPPLASGWMVRSQLPCLQMISERLPEAPDPAVSIIDLTPAEAAELYDLVQLVQPGYFMPETWRMGRYTGIRENGRLVAVAGERMRLDGLTELSAICTHPDHTGRGYAGQLVAGLVHRQRAEGITPFLHVAGQNDREITFTLLSP